MTGLLAQVLLVPVVAGAPAGPSPQGMAWYLTLWGMLAIAGVVVVALFVAVVLGRRRVRARQTQPPRAGAPIKDAWAEAGKRAEPATVDLDPDSQDEGAGR